MVTVVFPGTKRLKKIKLAATQKKILNIYRRSERYRSRTMQEIGAIACGPIAAAKV